MKKLLMTIGAAAMLPFATFAAWSEDAYTTTIDGVTWKYKVDAENNRLMLGTSTTTTAPAIDKTTSGKLCVPTSIVHEGVSYNVTDFGYGAFRGCESLTGIVIPKTTFSQTGRTTMFRVVTRCRAIWWQGPETVTDGEQPTANITDLTAFIRQSSGATNPKVVLFGPNVTHSTSVNTMFQDCNGTVAFLPKAHWSAGSYGGTNCKQIFYGPGEDIDISIDGTFTVATSNRLDEVLSVANYLHDYCDMNPKINVTNVIEVADGMITAGKLAFLDNRTFNSLVFKVNTQAQLDTLLAAIPSSVPFAINPADSKVELTVPQGREVYVKLSAEGRNGKYRPKINGLMITFF